MIIEQMRSELSRLGESAWVSAPTNALVKSALAGAISDPDLENTFSAVQLDLAIHQYYNDGGRQSFAPPREDDWLDYILAEPTQATKYHWPGLYSRVQKEPLLVQCILRRILAKLQKGQTPEETIRLCQFIGAGKPATWFKQSPTEPGLFHTAMKREVVSTLLGLATMGRPTVNLAVTEAINYNLTETDTDVLEELFAAASSGVVRIRTQAIRVLLNCQRYSRLYGYTWPKDPGQYWDRLEPLTSDHNPNLKVLAVNLASLYECLHHMQANKQGNFPGPPQVFPATNKMTFGDASADFDLQISIPAGVEIANFRNNHALVKLWVPNSVRTLEVNGCTRLKEVEVPYHCELENEAALPKTLTITTRPAAT